MKFDGEKMIFARGGYSPHISRSMFFVLTVCMFCMWCEGNFVVCMHESKIGVMGECMRGV